MNVVPDLHRFWPHDPLRKAVQTALAAILTFGVMRLADLPEVSWAVISALFVVQSSVGSTLTTVIGRLGGAVLGTAIGLACLWGIGFGGWQTIVSLGVAALAMDLIAYRYPSLSYGHVTAGILIVSQIDGTDGESIMSLAVDRAVAIGIGAAVAGLCAGLVFPERAHRAAERSLGEALRRCGDLLQAALAGLLAEDDRKLGPIHDGIQEQLETARLMIGQSRRKRAKRPGSPLYSDVLHSVNRLWHTLIIIDRIDVRPLPEDLCAALGPPLHEISEVSCRYLEDLGRAVAETGKPPMSAEVRHRLDALNELLDRIERPSALTAERVFSLAFALSELAENFDEIAGLFRGARHADAGAHASE